MRNKKSYCWIFSFRFLSVCFILTANHLALTTSAYSYTVKATREGLVGGITSNGHTIVPYDWFVALPSVKNLAKNNSWDTAYGVNQSTPVRVRVTYNGRSAIAPVWDVGPWNTKDDYWNSNSVRGIYTAMSSYWAANSAPKSPNLPPGWDPAVFTVPPINALLSLGNPEASHAYNTSAIYSTASYNYGCDQFGRHRWYTANSLNGSGIDLADGLFWRGLKMTGNFSVNWDFTTDLPQVKRVLITSGTTILYDSQNQISQTIQTGSKLNVKIFFSVTMSTHSPSLLISTGSYIISASTGSFSQTTYLLDTWTGEISIPQDAPSGVYTISIDAQDPGGNRMDADENTTAYNPGTDTIHKITIQRSAPPLPPPPAISSATHIVISQFATRGTNSAADEFVELYNPTTNSISLAGYQLQYLSATGTSWSTRLTFPSTASIAAGGYYLTANPAGYSSPNSGPVPNSNWNSTSGIADDGHLRLIDSAGNEVDRVGYGSAAQPEGGTPGAPNHGTSANTKSVGRTTDGTDTDVNRNDFSVRSSRNPKAASSYSPPPPPPPPAVPSASSVVISQFATRGGNSAYDEFVELFNPTTNNFSLGGWQLQYLSATGTSWSTRLTLPSGIMLSSQTFFLTANPTGYISGTTGPNPDLWWSSTSGIADDGHLRLIDSAGNEVDRVGYGSATQPEGGTPGAPNHGTSANTKSVIRSTPTLDSNINRNDFVVSTSRNPRNSYSPVSIKTTGTNGASSSSSPDSSESTSQLKSAPSYRENNLSAMSFSVPPQPEDFALREIFVYPNPVYPSQGHKPTFRIEIGRADRIEIRIYTIAGELLHSADIPAELKLTSDNTKWVYEYSGWDISNIASGVYLFLIRAERAGAGIIKQLKKIAIIR